MGKRIRQTWNNPQFNEKQTGRRMRFPANPGPSDHEANSGSFSRLLDSHMHALQAILRGFLIFIMIPPRTPAETAAEPDLCLKNHAKERKELGRKKKKEKVRKKTL